MIKEVCPMDDEAKREAKIAKKAAKAAAKAQKKSLAQSESASPIESKEPPPPVASGENGLSPAERSAAAAERQVRLQTYRVLIAVVVALVTLATLIVTTRPFWQAPSGDEPSDNAAAVTPSAP
jgi:hypothetical protein